MKTIIDTILLKEYQYLEVHKHPHLARAVLHLVCCLHIKCILFHLGGIIRELLTFISETFTRYIDNRGKRLVTASPLKDKLK